jgi:membrane associated rhomboid family serine protease
MAMAEGPQSAEHPLRERALWCVSLLALLWLVELANLLEGHVFHSWGILPRTRVGLRGVLFAPFIHQSPEHLALNSVPLFVLAWLVLTHGTREFLRVSSTVILLAGLGVWTLGRQEYHIGASGLVLGYFGFLVASVVYERSWTNVLIAALAVLLYGGLVLGVFPGRGGVSWESHLCGLLAGGLAAWAGGRRG